MKASPVAVAVLVLAGIAGLLVLVFFRPEEPKSSLRPPGAGTGAESTTNSRVDDATPVAVSSGTRLAPESAETVPPLESFAPRKRRRLTGVILDGRSREPVTAQVSWGGASALTSKDGSVSLIGHDGEALDSVHIVASGYEPQDIPATCPGPDDWDLGRVLLVPRDSTVVTVRDLSGDPRSGATVSVFSNASGEALARGIQAGETDSDGQLCLRVREGECLVACIPREEVSAVAVVRAAQDVLELVLMPDLRSVRWIGVRDGLSGEPRAGHPVEVVSTRSLPAFRWVGQSGQDGVIPVPLPPGDVEVRTLPPTQFGLEAGRLDTLAVVELGGLPVSGEVCHWLDLRDHEGEWVRFVSAVSGIPLGEAVAHSFRSALLPDGGSQEFSIGSTPLLNGLLDLTPFLEDSAEPVHARVIAAGYRPFDSRTDKVQTVVGQVVDVPLQPVELGAFRLVEQPTSADDQRSGKGSRSSIWMLGTFVGSPAIRLEPDSTGLVTGVPSLSQPVLVCTSPSPMTSIARLQPGDLNREPPIEVRVPTQSQIVVEFDPDDAPSRELRILARGGELLLPSLVGNDAVFDGLAAGDYFVGTICQIEASRRRRLRTPESGLPIHLGDGEVLRIRAEQSWTDWLDTADSIFGTVRVFGPSTAVVIPLFEGAEFQDLTGVPRLFSPIGASGDYSLPARPDIRSLAAGVYDPEEGAFIPLATFAVGEKGVVAKGAKLIVHPEGALTQPDVLELRLEASSSSQRIHLSRGVVPQGPPADFGWVPLGTHMIGPLGSPLSRIVVDKAGVLELVLRVDNSVSLKE